MLYLEVLNLELFLIIQLITEYRKMRKALNIRFYAFFISEKNIIYFFHAFLFKSITEEYITLLIL